MNEGLRQDAANHVFELPDQKYIGDQELDRVIDHARRFGRCLFTVAGGNVLELILNDNDSVGLRT
jgi:hypothetical protein